MELQLEVLSSVSIKRKKPWPKFAWLGEVRTTNACLISPAQFMLVLITAPLQSSFYSQPCSSLGLFLLDNHRMSQLSLSTGKTKKKFSSLSSIQAQLTLTCCSPSGAFLAGLTTNGDFFVWHQPTEVLETYQSPLSRPRETAGKVKGPQDFHGTFLIPSELLDGLCTRHADLVLLSSYNLASFPGAR